MQTRQSEGWQRMRDARKAVVERVRSAFHRIGVDIHRVTPDVAPDMDAEFDPLWRSCQRYTMTPASRGYALYKAVDYIVSSGVQGAFVECGVWRGGSSMLAARSFMQKGSCPNLYLFDTYEGMSEPSSADVDYTGSSARPVWESSRGTEVNEWCFASLEDVRANLFETNYPAAQLHFIKGKVEDTLSTVDTGPISILRLDTDWYESTVAELDVLYPRLVPGGVLILDDYGYWQGARRAVDEYLSTLDRAPLLFRVDESCRTAVKPG